MPFCGPTLQIHWLFRPGLFGGNRKHQGLQLSLKPKNICCFWKITISIFLIKDNIFFANHKPQSLVIFRADAEQDTKKEAAQEVNVITPQAASKNLFVSTGIVSLASCRVIKNTRAAPTCRCPSKSFGPKLGHKF
jgi:hypothetical protein